MAVGVKYLVIYEVESVVSVQQSASKTNVIILGSGRSGTSVTTHLLAESGMHLGRRLLPANEGNPNGRFEDVEVNAINEEILAKVVPRRPPLIGDWLFRHIPVKYQRWLAAVPVSKDCVGDEAIESRIRSVVDEQPFCFKDPRFCYTLPVWRPFVSNVKCVCVFRHPVATARSMVKEHDQEPAMKDSLTFNFAQGMRVWKCMYSHVLEKHVREGEWMFLHYRQLLAGDGALRLGEFLGRRVNPSVVSRELERSSPDVCNDREANRIYAELCQRANYKE